VTLVVIDVRLSYFEQEHQS
jgi:hypothetical protein